MTSYECLKILAPLVKDDDLVVTAIGGTAGEWSTVRHKESNLYQIKMGLCTPVCLGLALALPHRRVVGLEADGSVLFYLGNLTTLANKKPKNLMIIAFDNECYLSAGGLPSATSGGTDLAGIARAAGIIHSYEVKTLQDFEEHARAALDRQDTTYIVAKVDPTSQGISDNTDGKESKHRFVRYIEKIEGIKFVGMHGIKL